MPARKIGTLLGAAELEPLSRKARRLMELQKAFLESAPRSLSPACRVKHFEAGTLFLVADNAAVATKLRQLAPSLLSNIRKREAEITKIRVGVQVKDSAYAPPARRVRRPLSSENIEIFRKLADALPDSALKAAVSALVRRHERRR